jgi:hypothetical protein
LSLVSLISHLLYYARLRRFRTFKVQFSDQIDLPQYPQRNENARIGEHENVAALTRHLPRESAVDLL